MSEFASSSPLRGAAAEGCRSSAGLFHSHVPLDETPDLALGVAASHHALDEFAMLLFRLAVLLGPEADDGQELLDLREHPPLDHLTDLFVARPGGIAPAVGGP